MNNRHRPLDVPIGFCFLPTDLRWVPAWKVVHGGGEVPAGAFALYASIDGRFLYRIVEYPGHRVVQRATIVRGEFRPHRFYANGDWGSVFPAMDAWVELARLPPMEPRALDDPACDFVEADMIRRVAEDRGITEAEVRAEIAAREAEVIGDD